MAHDVFVCCAEEDEDTAQAVAAALEAQGIRCWIARRDLPPGLPREQATADAIDGSRAVVVVFSSSANTSPDVRRELEHAADTRTPIIPFRIEDAPVSGPMQPFISGPHRTDAFTPPLEQHLPRLGDAVARRLGEDVTRAAPATEPDAQLPLLIPDGPPVAPGPSSGSRKYHSLGRGLVGVVLLSVIAVALILHIQAVQSDPWRHYQRGATLMARGRYEEALAAFDRAVELETQYVPVHDSRAWLLIELGRYEEALAAYDRAIKLDAYDFEALENRKWVLAELGRHEELLDPYDWAIESDPDSAWAHHRKGAALAELGRYEEALEAYDRTIKLRPGDAWAHSVKGSVLAKLGRYEEALAVLDSAFELGPDEARVHYSRAFTYSLMGRRDDALRDLTRAIDLDADLREEARMEEGFDRLQDDREFRELVGLGEPDSQ